jgi:hypothetical protein
LNPVTMAKSGIQTRRQATTWLPEFNLHLAGSIGVATILLIAGIGQR